MVSTATWRARWTASVLAMSRLFCSSGSEWYISTVYRGWIYMKLLLFRLYLKKIKNCLTPGSTVFMPQSFVNPRYSPRQFCFWFHWIHLFVHLFHLWLLLAAWCSMYGLALAQLQTHLFLLDSPCLPLVNLPSRSQVFSREDSGTDGSNKWAQWLHSDRLTQVRDTLQLWVEKVHKKMG